MESLYDIARNTIDSDNNEDAARTLYGFSSFPIDTSEYYKRIISTFVKKKDIIIKQKDGNLVFDLTNVNDLWSILFIAEYLREEIDKLGAPLQKRLGELEKEYTDIIKKIDELESKEEKGKQSKQLKPLSQKITSLKARIKNDITDFKDELFDFTSFEKYKSINFEQDTMISKDILNHVREAIKSIHILRNAMSHDPGIPDQEFAVKNEKKTSVEIRIPMSYLDGFNKGRIIARESDRVILERTAEVISPILEYFNYDVTKLESFFYNVEPKSLSYLLRICGNDTNNLYRLPYFVFFNTERIKDLTEYLLKSKGTQTLNEEDYELLRYIDRIDNIYINNIIILLKQKERLKLKIKDIPILSKILSEFNINLEEKDDIAMANKILHNYHAIKDTYAKYSKYFDISELPYDIFDEPNTPFITKPIDKIIKIKMTILLSKDNKKEKLIKIFKYIIDDTSLYMFLDDIIDMLANVNRYAPDKDPYEYIENFLISIINERHSFNNRKQPITNAEISEIDSLIDEYKSNKVSYYRFRTAKIDAFDSEIKTYGYPKKFIISIVESFYNSGADIMQCLKDHKIGEDEYYWIRNLIPFMEQLYFLIEKTQDIAISIDIIMKLSNYLDISGQNELWNMDVSLTNNFFVNIERLLERYKPADILKYPPELLICNPDVFEHLFETYNENLCKSIFGIEDPKIIAALIYANSVFSQYKRKESDFDLLRADFDTFIHACFNDTYIYRDNVEGMNVDQESYLRQFLFDGEKKRDERGVNSNLVDKLRNAFAHFRFKIVYDVNGNQVPNKLYIYDRYTEDSPNNFNLIVDLNELLNFTRQVEEGLSKKTEEQTNIKGK